MPPVVAAAAITGIASGASAIASSRIQSGASRRAGEIQDRASARAERFELEQDARNRADQERRDAEDRRRWDVEQANLAREREEMNARTAYEDAIRYGKAVNLARLTGQAPPPKPPSMGGAASAPSAMPDVSRVPSAPILSRSSQANATIAAPGSVPMQSDGFWNPQQRGLTIGSLVGKRKVI